MTTTQPHDPRPHASGVPVAPRLVVVDALRGFALFGVVVANLVGASGLNPSAHPELVASPGDRVAFIGVQQVLIAGKFMGLFALLFGVGFALMLDRQAARGEPFVGRYLRRTSVLFLLGVLSFLLGNGDVLHLYAILALVVLMCRNAGPRTLLVAAVASLFLDGLAGALTPIVSELLPSPRGLFRQEDALKTAGELGPLVAFRLQHLGARLWPALMGHSILAFFFAGVLIARSGLLSSLETKGRLLKRATLACAVATVIGLGVQMVLRQLLGHWTPPLYQAAHTGLYFFGFLLLWSRAGRTQRWLARLAPAGRMALSWYLVVPVIGHLLFVTTGSYQRVGALAGTLIGIGLFLAMVVTSHWWLGQYRMGPVEWVWRSLTCGRRQLMLYMERYMGLRPRPAA